MSNLRRAPINLLSSRDDRALAKLAVMARNDVHTGTAKAAVMAHRLVRMGSVLPVDDVVSCVYTSDCGSVPAYTPYECPECGSVHLGHEAAASCCAYYEDDTEDYDDDPEY